MAETGVKEPGPEETPDAADATTADASKEVSGEALARALEKAKDAGRASPRERRRVTDSGAAILITVLLASGAIAALAMPRPVAPTVTPVLVLAPGEVEEALRAGRELAAQAPEGPAVDAFLEAYHRFGASQQGPSTEAEYRRNRTVMSRTTTELRQAHGDEAVAQLRAQLAGRLDDALRGTMEEPERTAFLGDFETMLSKYELVEGDRWRASELSVRVLYMARINAIIRAEPTDGFSPIERQAYWGWLALETRDHENAPYDLRLSALAQYEDALGEAMPEARGVLLFHAGESLLAADAFDEAYALTGNLRLRNNALAALIEANVEP